MSLTSSLNAAFSAVGSDVGNLKELLNGSNSDLSALTTTDKSNLVAALNELKAALDSTISDNTTSIGTTWSSSKVSTEISAAIAALVGGAPAALDTLNELAAAFNDNPTIIDTLLSGQANRVAVDQVQSFSASEQLQACQNIGVGDPSVDFLNIYTTSRDM